MRRIVIGCAVLLAACVSGPAPTPGPSTTSAVNPVPPPAGPFRPASAGVPFPLPASLGRLSPAYNNTGWAGYVLTRSSLGAIDNHGYFHYVQAFFQVPAISKEQCAVDPGVEVAFWVGLDGGGTGDTVEQAGVFAGCQGYGGVWEMYPGAPMGLDYVNPGDQMFASAEYDEATGRYKLRVLDQTSNLDLTSALPEQSCGATPCANATAEIITEDPQHVGGGHADYADYGVSTYTGIIVKDAGPEYGSITSQNWNNDKWFYANQGLVVGRVVYAQPSDPWDSGQAFNVAYQPPRTFTPFDCNWADPSGVPAPTDSVGGVNPNTQPCASDIIRKVNWGEISLPAGTCGSTDPVQVHGGMATISPPGGFRGFATVQAYVVPVVFGDAARAVAYGDLAGNGGAEAAVDVDCETGGHTAGTELGDSIIVYGLDEQNQLKLFGVLPSIHPDFGSTGSAGPTGWFSDIKIVPGAVTAAEHYYNQHDILCCATGLEHRTWSWEPSAGFTQPSPSPATSLVP